jgi:NitT/TauT family transport system ATP-binding protein
VREQLLTHLPMQDVEAVFKTVVSWGRFAELVGFDAGQQVLYLDQT